MNLYGIVDFHSHILPGIDDGSASVEESMAMLRAQTEQGIRHVVATPHFYAQHDSVDAFLQRRAEAERQFRKEMEKHDDLPAVTVGAEVYYFRGLGESEVLKELTIGETKYVLIEMPYAKWTDSMYRDLEQIYDRQGLTPIVAHVDRYLGRFRSFGIPKRLEELPVLVQANASFFCGYGSFRAMRMLEKGQIHLLGSDCHNMHNRRPNLGVATETIRRRLGTAALERIEEIQNHIFNSD